MADRGSSEKHGLALFCAFIVSWALIRSACQKPPAVADEPYPFSSRSSRRYAPAAVVPAGDGGGPVMTPPEPAFKRDAVSILSQAASGGAPPAMMDETAAGPASGGAPASASAAAPRQALSGGLGWQMSPESGGARPSASVMQPGGSPSPSGGPPDRSASAPSRDRSTASAGPSGPAGPAAAKPSVSAGAAGAGPGGPAGISAGAPSGGGADPLAGAAAVAPHPSNAALQSAAAATDSGGAAAGGGGGGGGAGGGSAGGGGGAGGAGGGGGGGGGGLGGGGPTAQKPKGSAGPPAGGAAAAAGGSTGGGGGGGGSGPGDGSDQIADVKPALEEPQLESPAATGEAFAQHPHEPPSVPIAVDAKTGAVKFMAKMAIDVDGAGGYGAKDPTNIRDGKPGNMTAALLPNGKPLNPMVIPFIVVPSDFGHGVRLGDYVAVTYGGRTTMAIVGDIGPKGIVGEASPAVARPLGIPSSASSGGVGSGVTYVVLPGSRDKAIPDSAAKIDAQARARFAQKGIAIR